MPRGADAAPPPDPSTSDAAAVDATVDASSRDSAGMLADVDSPAPPRDAQTVSETGTQPVGPGDLARFEILKLEPEGGVIRDPSAKVSVTFSASLDPGTVTLESVRVVRHADEVAGQLSVSDNVISFQPTRPWVLSADYTVQLSGAIQDTMGRALVASSRQLHVRDGTWSRGMISGVDPLFQAVQVTKSPGGQAALLIRRMGVSAGVPATGFVVRATPAGGWTDPVQVCGVNYNQLLRDERRIAINESGHVVVTCADDTPGTFAATRFHGGPDWTTIMSPPVDAYRIDPTLVLTPDETGFTLLTESVTVNGIRGAAGPVLQRFSATAAQATATRLADMGSSRGLAVLRDRVIAVWQKRIDTDAGTATSAVMAAVVGFDGQCILRDNECARQLSSPSIDASDAMVAADPISNSAIVVWNEGAIASASYAPETDWTQPIRAPLGTGAATLPNVGIDATGTAQLTFLHRDFTQPRYTLMVARLGKGGAAWSTPQGLAVQVDEQRPQLAVGAGGDAVAAWIEAVEDTSGITRNLARARYVPEVAQWERVSTVDSGSYSGTPNVGIDDSGRALIAWVRSGTVFVYRYE